jgi:hypothetical protein
MTSHTHNTIHGLHAVEPPTATAVFFLCMAHRGLPPPLVQFTCRRLGRTTTTLDWQATVQILDSNCRPVPELFYASAMCSSKSNAKNHACDQALEDIGLPNVLAPLAQGSLLNGLGAVCGECKTWRVLATNVCHRLDLHASPVTAVARCRNTREMLQRKLNQQRLTRQALADLQLQHVPAPRDGQGLKTHNRYYSSDGEYLRPQDDDSRPPAHMPHGYQSTETTDLVDDMNAFLDTDPYVRAPV